MKQLSSCRKLSSGVSGMSCNLNKHGSASPPHDDNLQLAPWIVDFSLRIGNVIPLFRTWSVAKTLNTCTYKSLIFQTPVVYQTNKTTSIKVKLFPHWHLHITCLASLKVCQNTYFSQKSSNQHLLHNWFWIQYFNNIDKSSFLPNEQHRRCHIDRHNTPFPPHLYIT